MEGCFKGVSFFGVFFSEIFLFQMFFVFFKSFCFFSLKERFSVIFFEGFLFFFLAKVFFFQMVHSQTKDSKGFFF